MISLQELDAELRSKDGNVTKAKHLADEICRKVRKSNFEGMDRPNFDFISHSFIFC